MSDNEKTSCAIIAMSARQKRNSKTATQNTQFEYVSGQPLLWIHRQKEFLKSVTWLGSFCSAIFCSSGLSVVRDTYNTVSWERAFEGPIKAYSVQLQHQ